MMLTAWFDRFLSLTLPPLPHNNHLQQGFILIFVITTGLIIAWLPPLRFMFLLGGSLYLLLILRYPLLALYTLIPLIPFSPLVAIPLGGVRAGLMEIILLLGLGSWLLAHLAQPPGPHLFDYAQDRPRPLSLWERGVETFPLLGERTGIVVANPSRPVSNRRYIFTFAGAFLLFLGAVGFSWLTTFSIAGSLVETAKWVEMLMLYLFITTLLPARQTKWLVVVILLSGAAQAGLGLYQFIFKVGPPGFLLFDGRFLRAYGTFAQPNPYAGYLGLILPLALALTIWAGLELLPPPNKPKTSDWKLKIFNVSLYGVPLALMLVALFASQSRAAWLAFLIASTATVIAGSKKPGVLLTGLVTFAVTIALVGAIDWSFTQVKTTTDTNSTYSIISQRLIEATTIATLRDIATIEVTDANFSTLERLAHWQAAREMWRDNPWLGVGFGNYAAIYPAYAVGRWLDPLGHAHNYLLNLGAETGLVGIMGYLIFWILVFGVTWSAIRKSRGFHRALAVGCFGSLIHLHVHNLFDNLYVQGMYLYVAIILALISITLDTYQPSDDKIRSLAGD